MFLDMINSARHRIWIVSPYFVPDDDLISALQLAALRGVDVRILIPENPDHKLVWLASMAHAADSVTGSASSNGESPTSSKFCASWAFVRYKMTNLS